MELLALILIVYSIMAAYSGWNFVTNNIPRLNKPGWKYRIIKLICGYIIGIVWLVVGFFIRIVKWMLRIA